MNQILFSRSGWIILVLTLFPVAFSGQGTFEKTYPTTYDKTSRDIINTGTGYLLAGMTNNGNLYDCELYVMKTDYNGEFLWGKTYGGSKPDYAYDIEETNDGNYFVVGYTQSFGGGDLDIYLIKIDPDGNLIWEKTYIGFGNEEGREIIKTADGNFVIVGSTNSNLSSQDAFLMKIDNDGVVIWIKYYGGPEKEFGNSVKLCADGGFILTGQTFSSGQNGDVYLVRTNSAGDPVWSKFYGGGGADEGVSVIANDDGSFTFAVRDSSSSSDIDVRVIKVNSSGDVIWSKLYSGALKDTPKSMVATSDGGYFIGAISRSFGWINPEMWLLKLNSSGDTTWTRRFGSSDHEHCHVVKQITGDSYLAAGHARSWGPGQKIYFLKLNSEGVVALDEQIADENKFNIYPNPVNNGALMIRMERPGALSVTVCDALGRTVFSEKMEVSGTDEPKIINLEHSRPGMYLLTLEYQNTFITKKLFIE